MNLDALFTDQVKEKEDCRYSLSLKFLDDCEELNHRIEDFLEDESNKFEALWQDGSVNHTDVDSFLLDDLIHEYDEGAYKIKNLFPYILRSSLFLSCYSFFENLLEQICRLYESEAEQGLKLKEIQGSGIHRSRIFLKKVVGVIFPDEEPEWAELLFYNAIRNLIAHGSEMIYNKDSGTQKLIDEIKKRSLISLKNGIIITLNRGFVSESIETMRSFVRKMYNRMPNGF